MKILKISIKALSLTLTSLGLLFVACNKPYPDKGLRSNYPADGAGLPSATSKKVLYLIVDGARGSEVKSSDAPSFKNLSRTAFYTYNAVSGYQPADTTLLSAWATMLTGVTSEKHNVVNNFDAANLDKYPSVVKRLKMENPTTKVSAFSSSNVFADNFTADADVNVTLPSDEAVTEALISELATNDDVRLVIGQFNSVDMAGKMSNDYTIHNPAYVAAIKKVDSCIGKIVKAVQSRPNYMLEDWLIIVASNQNGVVNLTPAQDSLSAYDDTRRNSLVFIQNPRFIRTEIEAPKTSNGLSVYRGEALIFDKLGSEGVKATIPNTGKVFEVEKGGGMTIECKVKFVNQSIHVGQSYVNFIGTALSSKGQDGEGWGIKYNKWANENNFLFYAGRTGGEHGFASISKETLADNKWHSIVCVIDWSSNTSKYELSTYVDGEPNIVRKELNGGQRLGKNDANQPLTVGPSNAPGADANAWAKESITDIRIWDKAMPRELVQLMHCRVDVPKTFSYTHAGGTIDYDNLRAFYKVERSGIKDYSKYALPDGTISDPSGVATWYNFAEVTRGACPTPDAGFYRATPNGIDVPMHILQWLNIAPNGAWGLDGKYWPSAYEDVSLPERY